MDCMVCKKHKDFLGVTGEPLIKTPGLVLSHFPVLDGVPATKGHLLIEASTHLVNPCDLTEKDSSDLGMMIGQGMKVLMKVLGAEHVYVFRINDKVEHFHTHLIPRYPGTASEWYGAKIFDCPTAPKIGHGEVKALSRELKDLFVRK